MSFLYTKIAEHLCSAAVSMRQTTVITMAFILHRLNGVV